MLAQSENMPLLTSSPLETSSHQNIEAQISTPNPNLDNITAQEAQDTMDQPEEVLDVACESVDEPLPDFLNTNEWEGTFYLGKGLTKPIRYSEITNELEGTASLMTEDTQNNPISVSSEANKEIDKQINKEIWNLFLTDEVIAGFILEAWLRKLFINKQAGFSENLVEVMTKPLPDDKKTDFVEKFQELLKKFLVDIKNQSSILKASEEFSENWKELLKTYDIYKSLNSDTDKSKETVSLAEPLETENKVNKVFTIPESSTKDAPDKVLASVIYNPPSGDGATASSVVIPEEEAGEAGEAGGSVIYDETGIGKEMWSQFRKDEIIFNFMMEAVGRTLLGDNNLDLSKNLIEVMTEGQELSVEQKADFEKEFTKLMDTFYAEAKNPASRLNATTSLLENWKELLKTYDIYKPRNLSPDELDEPIVIDAVAPDTTETPLSKADTQKIHAVPLKISDLIEISIKDVTKDLSDNEKDDFRKSLNQFLKENGETKLLELLRVYRELNPAADKNDVNPSQTSENTDNKLLSESLPVDTPAQELDQLSAEVAASSTSGSYSQEMAENAVAQSTVTIINTNNLTASDTGNKLVSKPFVTEISAQQSDRLSTEILTSNVHNILIQGVEKDEAAQSASVNVDRERSCKPQHDKADVVEEASKLLKKDDRILYLVKETAVITLLGHNQADFLENLIKVMTAPKGPLHHHSFSLHENESNTEKQHFAKNFKRLVKDFRDRPENPSSFFKKWNQLLEKNNIHKYRDHSTQPVLKEMLSLLKTDDLTAFIANASVMTTLEGKKADFLKNLIKTMTMTNKYWQLLLLNTGSDLSDNEVSNLFDEKQEFEKKFKALSSKFADGAETPSSFLGNWRNLLNQYDIHAPRHTGNENDCIQSLADTVNNELPAAVNTVEQPSEPLFSHPAQLGQAASGLKQDSESVVINPAPDNPISSNNLHYISLYRMP